MVPPGESEVELPILPRVAGAAGLNGGAMILEMMTFIAAGRFDYEDFTYLDINGARWQTYGISTQNFTEF